jgi:hypothetical protein
MNQLADADAPARFEAAPAPSPIDVQTIHRLYPPSWLARTILMLWDPPLSAHLFSALRVVESSR